MYTGIYNIPDVEFDMSFRMQCSANYYSPTCTTVCKKIEGVYTCNGEQGVECIDDSQDFAVNCVTCLQGWDADTKCAACTNCTIQTTTTTSISELEC